MRGSAEANAGEGRGGGGGGFSGGDACGGCGTRACGRAEDAGDDIGSEYKRDDDGAECDDGGALGDSDGV